MQEPLSDYKLSLEYVLKTHQSFLSALSAYLNQGFASSQKLRDFFNIWSNQRGISALVKTLALQFKSTIDSTKIVVPSSKITYQQNVNTIGAIEVKNDFMKKEEVFVKEEQKDPSESQRSASDEKEDYQDDSVSYQQSNRSYYSKNYKRGPYKSYSMAEKEKAVRLFLENKLPITQISRMLKIPCKNIKRWSTQGIFRKRGGGRRKSSPEMEREVYRWIRQNYREGSDVQIDKVQQYALAVSGDDTFKASRGWVIKFLQRFRLKEIYHFK